MYPPNRTWELTVVYRDHLALLFSILAIYDDTVTMN